MFTFFRSEKKLHVFPLCGIGTNILFIWNIWKQMENCFLFLVIKTVFCIPVGSTSADSESADKKGQLYYATKHKELENPQILASKVGKGPGTNCPMENEGQLYF